MRVLVQSQEEAVSLCRSLTELVIKNRQLDLDEVSYANTENLLCQIRDSVEVIKPTEISESLKKIMADFATYFDIGYFIESNYQRLSEIASAIEGGDANSAG